MQLREDATIELSDEQRTELEKVVRSRRTPQAVAVRARIVLMTADGILPGAIGEQLGVSQPTIRKWRARYAEQGLAGLRSEPRPGRPRTLDDQRVADLLNQALQTRPAVDNYATHKHGKVKAWLARNPRLHLHFTPTYSSWLNQVERWFALITERAIRRNSFTSVRELKQQIELFV